MAQLPRLLQAHLPVSALRWAGGGGGGGGSLIHLGPLAPCLGIFSSLLCRVVGSGDLSSSVICLCATREFSDDQVPPPVEAQSLNHWVTREVLLTLHF